ncbi:thiol reductant ABC exporter subunit CydD [Arcanobacterium pinnipediorum]|uniref:Thiol reductant ABC exporter subunit CydD n=1 Tax=Arcanobacterium pinnipediorum TaxID=1503041 RepID=A0ABY5AFQ3_9ACTO|nr:thiol reductant ABC exporter subunit CydD [Arcanobacterium pinnipediorum]USR78835.1 thiol reductant ABC exporter subunit CydD [Arcanobacterium pinnipediorum]
MKPFDPRLLRYARATGRYLALLVGIGLLITALIGSQTYLIASIISPIFYTRQAPHNIATLIALLLGVFLARAVLSYIQGAIGHRSALRVISQLRTRVIDHAANLGSRWLSNGNTNEVVTLTTRGLDDLEDYFVHFLPELFLTATATPLLLCVVAYMDFLSAVMIVACLPLIPIFMILIGKMTASYSAQRLSTMQRLGAQLLDLLAGLPTLKGVGREVGPAKRVEELGLSFAQRTMNTLYVAFLSGAALEFITTLTTALVAVSIGLRMVTGHVLLFEGLVVIMLTPEVLRPLREVGTQFHASANGVAAANRVFKILETKPYQHTGNLPIPDMTATEIRLENVSVYAPGRATIAPSSLSAVIAPGKVTVIRGASGAGKSTTINTLLGLIPVSAGRILIGDNDLATLDRQAWWSNITWVTQRPALVPGTLAENLGSDPSTAEAQYAADLTGFSHVVNDLPAGWNTIIGQGGTGLSVGQRQRLALTKALVSTSQIVILDEPSAHLDAEAEEYVTTVIKELRTRGHTVIVIAHRAAMADIADSIMDVTAESRVAGETL